MGSARCPAFVGGTLHLRQSRLRRRVLLRLPAALCLLPECLYFLRTCRGGCLTEMHHRRKAYGNFLSLQSQDACNINLITPTQYIPQIITALKSAKKQGLSIPVVYNTGTYEKPEVLRSLSGLVDIYLPDFKYYSHRLSEKYSAVPDYREAAAAALAEMVRQTGAPVYDENTGLMKSGVIVRHMMLPGHLQDSKKVLSYLRDTYGDTIVYSVMSQYTPVRMFPDMPELNRRVSHREYNALLDYCLSIGIEDGYMQEGEAAESSFIPSFNGEGV